MCLFWLESTVLVVFNQVSAGEKIEPLHHRRQRALEGNRFFQLTGLAGFRQCGGGSKTMPRPSPREHPPFQVSAELREQLEADDLGSRIEPGNCRGIRASEK
jgi:hypothetical protein